METKICSDCEIEKSLDQFYKRSSGFYRSECKKCFCKKNRITGKIYRQKNQTKEYARTKKWAKENLESRKKTRKKYYETHKEARKKESRKYYQINKKEMIKKGNELQKKKRKENTEFRLLCNLRPRIHKALKFNIKSKRTIELLGCNIEFFKNYIEAKFQFGMTWENYGVDGWHIDHVKPCSSFDLSQEDEQKKCFHYSNLQPLWCYDNLKKGAK